MAGRFLVVRILPSHVLFSHDVKSKRRYYVRRIFYTLNTQYQPILIRDLLGNCFDYGYYNMKECVGYVLCTVLLRSFASSSSF